MNYFFRSGIVSLILSRSTDAQHLDYNRYPWKINYFTLFHLFFPKRNLKRNVLMYEFFEQYCLFNQSFS